MAFSSYFLKNCNIQNKNKLKMKKFFKKYWLGLIILPIALFNFQVNISNADYGIFNKDVVTIDTLIIEDSLTIDSLNIELDTLKFE